MTLQADVIVVGAGSAGAILARRLVDAGRDVLLFEAGGEDSNPALHDVLRLAELWLSPQDWGYYTVPQKNAANRLLHLPRGKVLGGSHALNAAIWVRGCDEDFAHWEKLGASGWGWADVAPVFGRIEAYDGQPAGARGTSGLLDVTVDYQLDPVQQSILDASVQAGLAVNPDYNSGTLDGVAKMQFNIRGAERWNTYKAYLKPVRDRNNLKIVTGARVNRLIVEDGAVVGVEVDVEGIAMEAYAAETVLCAGALDSPRVLLRSGIGPAAELRDLGVDTILDLPGVGRNLQDHLLSPVIFETTAREVGPPTPGLAAAQTHHFWRSREGLASPDTQPINFSVPMYSEEWMSGPDSGFSLMAGLVRPESRGSVTLTGPGADDPIAIDLNVFDVDKDLQTLVASLRKCREIGQQPALATEWGAREIYPGPGVETDEALADYARRTVITYHHQSGTCAMGTGPDAVVDPATLRVHGLRGLRVADASVFPRITSGNTNAPACLVGERAADFILAEEAG
ncbi:GMC family oxidoreductase [Nonomuraea sp. H19]|uniref:GMC family oxidoreductase n=1 Tax=Nonomuraea sp. H19 TaxID=3452206 RepID=UPI003F88C76A